jgi:hypothetical protein
MTTIERIALCNALADSVGELARSLDTLASELRGIGDEMMGSLGLSPIHDERQAPLPMRGIH